MTKQQLDKTTTVYATIAFALLFAVGAVAVQAATGTFSVAVTVNNAAPTITWVNNSFSYTPVADSTQYFQFHFNASDVNGADDLNDSTATIVISLGSQYSSTSNACTPTDDGNVVTYNCSVNISYFYNASAAWSINASVMDNSEQYVQNITETFTIQTLKAISLNESAMTFTGDPEDQNILANEGQQAVRNTGNFDFNQMNLTGYNLTGATYGYELGVKNFTVNVTDGSGKGQVIQHNSKILVDSADMTHGQGAEEHLWIYLDYPASIQPDTYNSQSNWEVEV